MMGELGYSCGWVVLLNVVADECFEWFLWWMNDGVYIVDDRSGWGVSGGVAVGNSSSFGWFGNG